MGNNNTNAKEPFHIPMEQLKSHVENFGNVGSNESPFKKSAKENITHMMNGGVCSWGKYNLKVFQGENGNFYIEDEMGLEYGYKSFSGLFGKLKIID